jgi:hypothetical protein
MRWLAAIAMAMSFVAFAAEAAPTIAREDGAVTRLVPGAASLLRFYPTLLASSPAGVVEDQEVWLAKVQGLIAGAPSMLQQSLLMSQTSEEFVSNLVLLEQMRDGLIKRAMRDLFSGSKAEHLTARALGDVNNTVYVPLTPCRIMDTRFATVASGVRGPITGGTLYQIPGYVSGAWVDYGAFNGDCGLGNSVGPNTRAIAIVMTILNPNFDSFLGVSDDIGTVQTNVALNFTHGQGLSNLYIVPQVNGHTIYFAMPSGLSAQLVFDVVGYFALSDATALQCNTQIANPVTITAHSIGNATIPPCGTGFTQTSTQCLGSSSLMTLFATNACSFINNDNVDHTAIGLSVCCRVPGK